MSHVVRYAPAPTDEATTANLLSLDAILFFIDLKSIKKTWKTHALLFWYLKLDEIWQDNKTLFLN